MHVTQFRLAGVDAFCDINDEAKAMEHWESYDWTDVTPIPYETGDPALSVIAYTSSYDHVMSYFRAVLKAEEISDRALALSAEVIKNNPAHYSAWDYRLLILKSIGKSVYKSPGVGLVKDVEPRIQENGDWINEVTLAFAKNYQVWNYRQNLETSSSKEYYISERNIVEMVLEDDPKNFHAWSHLKWAISHAKPLEIETLGPTSLLKSLEKMLAEDVENNSCWNFRFFVYENWPQVLAEESAIQAETEYSMAKIRYSPNNVAAWSYLHAFLSLYRPAFLQQLVDLAVDIKSTRGWEVAAYICESRNEPDRAKAFYDQLILEEPSKERYWRYKKELGEAGAASGSRSECRIDVEAGA